MTSVAQPRANRLDPESAVPLYAQVKEILREEALAGSFHSTAPLPSESVLLQRFGVSRGTIRQAIQELVYEGVLYREQGRGTYVMPAAQMRNAVWTRLRKVARPDARFHYDFTQFVPDYQSSEQGTMRIVNSQAYQDARLLFITPDNNLRQLREYALRDGKIIVASTHAIARGFVLLDGRHVPAGDRRLAATLDGMEEFSTRLNIARLAALKRIDLLVTGASAVTEEGVLLGKGQGYFDLEWGIFCDLGLVDARSPVVAAIHDCQLMSASLTPSASDTVVDVIVTPTRWITVASPWPKPTGIQWTRVTAQSYSRWPILHEVESYRAERCATSSRSESSP